jgi:hypothetical protein
MKKFIALTLTLLCLVACEKSADKILISDQVSKTQYYDNEIFNEQSQKIYGKWEYLYKLGGIAGVKIEPGYDYLEVVKFGIYGRIKDNNIKEIGRLIINKQDDNETVIDFFPDDIYKTDYFLISKIIRFQGNDTLILDDDYVDGFRDYYKRIK